jgi:hypothetical protein
LRIIKEGVAGKSPHLNFLGGEQRLGRADGHLRGSGLKSVKKMTATWASVSSSRLEVTI